MTMKPLLACLLLVFSAVGAAAQSRIEIDISKGVVQPLPIAISDLDYDNPQATKLGMDIARVIRGSVEQVWRAGPT